LYLIDLLFVDKDHHVLVLPEHYTCRKFKHYQLLV
jgi:hypothetical protein